MTVYGPLTLDAAEWGRERVLLAGQDVSFWRGFHTVIEERSHADPFGWRSATVYFPQATGHETLGVGDRSFLRKGVNVDIQRIKPDGTIDRAAPLFEGFATRISPVKTETSYGIRVECVGYLYQADMQVRTPHELGLRRPLVYGAQVVAWALNNVRGRRYRYIQTVNTPGWKTRKRGSMSQSPMNFAAELLAESWNNAGQRWTVLDYAAGRRAKLLLRKAITASVDYTISYGGRGVSITAVDDLTERPNVIYGSGVRPDGGAWSNYFYPGYEPAPIAWPGGATFTPGGAGGGFKPFSDAMRRSGFPDFGSFDTYRADNDDIEDVEQFQRRAGLTVTGDVNAATWNALFAAGTDLQSLGRGYHLPLAWDTRVEPYLYNGHGQVTGDNPAYDPSVLRVEKWVDYGAGITKREARRSARRELHVIDDPAWVITGTLRTNPVECHRNAMKSGRNLLVKHFGGGSGVVAHLTEITVTADGSVNFSADTAARDYMTVAQIVARNKEGRPDPARGILRRNTRGRTSFDQALQFDAESPAGHLAPKDLTAGQWTIITVPFGGWGQIVRAEFHTTPDAQFWAGISSKKPTRSQLNALVGNPATTTDSKPWDVNYLALRDQLDMFMTYGTKDSPAGYWPHDKTDTPTPALTGDYTDDNSFEWATDPDGRPVLYLSVFADRDTTISGRFYNAPQPL